METTRIFLTNLILYLILINHPRRFEITYRILFQKFRDIK